MSSGSKWEGGAQWQAAAARWQACGHGKWERTSWAQAWEDEQAAEQGNAVPPEAKHRRKMESGAEAAGAAAALAAAAVSEDADAETRKQQYQERLAKIVSFAIDAGVQPLSDEGEELHLLDPHRLDEWCNKHLPSAF